MLRGGVVLPASAVAVAKSSPTLTRVVNETCSLMIFSLSLVVSIIEDRDGLPLGICSCQIATRLQGVKSRL